MSLVAYALRTTLRQALLHRTHAEDRVFDSLITPVDQLAVDGALPLIIVSTDDDEGDLRFLNNRFEQNDRHLQIIIETTIASAFTVEAGVASVSIPHTDEGLEKTLDFMGRRVWRAMLEPASPWADLFRDFFGEGRRYYSRRGAGDTEGVLFAARQLVLVCDPIPEPDHGAAINPSTLWGRLVALMRETPELADYADVLEGEIVGAPLADWQTLQTRLGISRASLTTLGFGPLAGVDATPPVSRLTVETPLRRIVVEPEP